MVHLIYNATQTEAAGFPSQPSFIGDSCGPTSVWDEPVVAWPLRKIGSKLYDLGPSLPCDDGAMLACLNDNVEDQTDGHVLVRRQGISGKDLLVANTVDMIEIYTLAISTLAAISIFLPRNRRMI
jgi:hypothetical protein